MRRALLACLAALLAPVPLLAAPAAKADPVAEGYPAWTGVSAKSYVAGREISPSDLRHKVTVVVEIENDEKLRANLVQAARFASYGPGQVFGEFGASEVPRNYIFVLSLRGGNGRKKLLATIDPKAPENAKGGEEVQALVSLNGNGCSVYEDVTFAGAPDGTEKRPFVYVMGPKGVAPLCQGPLATTLADAKEAIAKGRKEVDGWDPKWAPFYGTVPEPKFYPQLAKALAAGKPLDPVAKDILRNVVSKEPEKAVEAQILYDAINQARSDLLLKIKMEMSSSPHQAYADAQRLLRCWPTEKKRVEALLAWLSSNPDLMQVAKAYAKMMTWSAPDFTCKTSEAKKIVADLKKMKKAISAHKESKNMSVQNAALLVDAKVDELIDSFSARCASK